MKQKQFKHNLSKAKRQKSSALEWLRHERYVLNNLFEDYSLTLINLTNKNK
jgi:hypothetical protein